MDRNISRNLCGPFVTIIATLENQNVYMYYIYVFSIFELHSPIQLCRQIQTWLDMVNLRFWYLEFLNPNTAGKKNYYHINNKFTSS